MIPSPIHLNLNIYASVYLETTGPLVGFHDIMKICILPLDNFCNPVKGVLPLLISFSPMRDEHPWIANDKYAELKVKGIHPSLAPSVLELWYKRLPITPTKKLCAISHNWAFSSSFMKDLFGPSLFDEVFHESPRDIMNVASYINDCCDINAAGPPFGRDSIGYLAGKLNVAIDEPKDVLNTCKALPLIYKALLRRSFGGKVL